MNPKQKKLLTRIIVALVLFVIIEVAAQTGILRAAFGTPGDVYAEFALFLIPYLIAGYDVIAGALRGLVHGHALDEDFLMTVATFGAFALVLFPDTEPHMAEGAAVMLFFQVGELFQSYAVDKSRQSIADMMDIAPEYANVMEEGKLKQADPFELAPDDEFIVMPGERIPLDGTVLTGESQIDTAALTGESVPRTARPGDEVISGCVNLTAKLVVRATKPFEDSTVSRILELVENAAEKKARTENFITRFARVYTPIVVGVAAVLAIVPPLLFGGQWSDWILRGLTFLVVSCPCALVISVPLSFFGGIGGASRLGILVKGSNYRNRRVRQDRHLDRRHLLRDRAHRRPWRKRDRAYRHRRRSRDLFHPSHRAIGARLSRLPDDRRATGQRQRRESGATGQRLHHDWRAARKQLHHNRRTGARRPRDQRPGRGSGRGRTKRARGQRQAHGGP